MNILSSCALCSNSFTPRNTRQKYCTVCIHNPCTQCGTKKDVRATLCKKCEMNRRIGIKMPKRKQEQSFEQIVLEIEQLGLLPDRQYSFGYVIGAIFGDGGISKGADRTKHRNKNGSTSQYITETYRPRLSVTSEAFARKFATHWETLTGANVKIWSYIRTDFSKSTLKSRKDGYSVRLFNVSPRHARLGRYLAYLKYDSELYELLRFPLEVMRGFIHGMIDSEGYVSNTYTDISNKRITLLDVIAIMLECLGYKATVCVSPSQKTAHLRTGVIYNKFH